MSAKMPKGVCSACTVIWQPAKTGLNDSPLPIWRGACRLKRVKVRARYCNNMALLGPRCTSAGGPRVASATRPEKVQR